MDTETTETDVDTAKVDGEGEVDTLTIPKKDYETLNQTLGSLKREIKDLKKSSAKEENKETPQTNPEVSHLLQKLERTALRQAGITHPDDVELARKTAEKWKVDVDEVVDDEDFKAKLERQQTSRTNVEATSKVRGGAGTGQAKNTVDYWLAKGSMPPAEANIDKKTRTAILKAFMKNADTGGRVFYND